ncbi:hypothetical protein BGZ57DRAFT_927219 [Hyaloscypha finlandica]|nr:hypothetical protein BGZ57DRAFT_927219 [Hyaloscypha finlandica]
MPRGSPNSNTTDSPQNELAETHTTETQENATILISDSEGSGDPDYDPDLNLDQYAATTFTTESGFRHHQIGRDINDLPQEKQRQVMKLFKALPAPEIEEDEDGGGPAQTDWTEQEEALIAERWGGRAPGVGDYERARGRRDRGLKLTEHELKLLEDSIDTALDNMDPDDEFLELDRHQEDILQINATRETAEALEFWKGKVQNESRGKRMAPGPSPSKPSSTGKPLRSAKKVKRGGKK